MPVRPVAVQPHLSRDAEMPIQIQLPGTSEIKQMPDRSVVLPDISLVPSLQDLPTWPGSG